VEFALDVPLLLYVGRLDPDKRVGYVVQAAVQTMKKNNARLIVVGDGVEKTLLLNLSNSLRMYMKVMPE